MGLMDKVKAQATQLADKAQQAGQAGQAKLADIQAKRKATPCCSSWRHHLLPAHGRAEAGADVRVTEIVGLVQAFEAEHGRCR